MKRLAIPLLIVLVLLGMGAVFVASQVSSIRTNIEDTYMSADQEAFIDEVSRSPDCDDLRGVLANAQEALADEANSIDDAFPRRVAAAAEAQLDRMRCGG